MCTIESKIPFHSTESESEAIILFPRFQIPILVDMKERLGTLVDLFNNGGCFYFATQMNKEWGYPIAAIQVLLESDHIFYNLKEEKKYKAGDWINIHYVCRYDGRLVDCYGIHDESDLLKSLRNCAPEKVKFNQMRIVDAPPVEDITIKYQRLGSTDNEEISMLYLASKAMHRIFSIKTQ